jgi:hypothetical protein
MGNEIDKLGPKDFITGCLVVIFGDGKWWEHGAVFPQQNGDNLFFQDQV